jgi:hypothetical protein
MNNELLKQSTNELTEIQAPVAQQPNAIWDDNLLVPLAGVILSAIVAITKEILAHRAEIKAKEAERVRWLAEQNDLFAKSLLASVQGKED